MSRPRILFVDDEPFFAYAYIHELEKDATVVLEETATGAIEAVKSGQNWDAIVLDVMMPSPEGRADITSSGMDTGIWVLSEIRDKIVADSVPVIILTNRNIPHIAECLERFHEGGKISRDLVVVRSKAETPRFLLPRIIRAAIERFRPASSVE